MARAAELLVAELRRAQEILDMVAVGTTLIAPRTDPWERHYRITLEDWRGVLLLATPLKPWDTRPCAVSGIGARLRDVLLGPRPFLPRLRRRSLLFVRLSHR
jgi:hypothetical protein